MAGFLVAGLVAILVVVAFFVLGYTGVYYSCMATVVSADEMAGATAGGQLALIIGALVAPPVFGRLADIFGYRAPAGCSSQSVRSSRPWYC